MAITYEYVGKTGGGIKFNTISVPSYYTTEASKTLTTVPVPSGVSATVIVSLSYTGPSNSSGGINNWPEVVVGSSRITVGGSNDRFGGGVFQTTGPVQISHVRNSTINGYSVSVNDFIVRWWAD